MSKLRRQKQAARTKSRKVARLPKLSPWSLRAVVFVALFLVAAKAWFSYRHWELVQDRKEITRLTQLYLKAYSSRNLKQILEIWDPHSPDYPYFSTAATQLFKDCPKIVVDRIKLDPPTVDGQNASIRAAFSTTVSIREYRKHHDIAYVVPKSDVILSWKRTSGRWELQSSATEDEALVDDLLSCKTFTQRIQWVTAHPKITSEMLLTDLTGRASGAQLRGNYRRSADILRLEIWIADRLHSDDWRAPLYARLADVSFQSGGPGYLYMLRAIRIYRKLKQPVEIAGCLEALAHSCRGQNRYNEAMSCYRLAVNALKSMGRVPQENRSELIDVYLDESQFALDHSHFDEAMAASRSALGYSDTDSLMKITSLNALAKAYGMERDYAQALRTFKRSLSLLDAVRASEANAPPTHFGTNKQIRLAEGIIASLGDRVDGGPVDASEIRRIMGNYGTVLGGTTHADSVIEALQKTQQIDRATWLLYTKASALAFIAQTEYWHGDFSGVVRDLDQTVNLWNGVIAQDPQVQLRDEQGQDPRLTALVYEGRAFIAQDDWSSAERCYRRALTLHGARAPGWDAASAALADLYLNKGQLAEASRWYARSLEAARTAHHSDVIASCVGGLAEINVSRGDYRAALKSLSDDAGNVDPVRKELILAYIYTKQGDQKQALDSFTRALDLAISQPGSLTPALIAMQIGELYASQGDSTAAFRFIRQGVSLAGRKRRRFFHSLEMLITGLIYQVEKDNGAALHYLRAGLKIGQDLGDTSLESGALLRIGQELSRQGHFGEADYSFAKSAAIYRDCGDPAGLAAVKAAMAYEQILEKHYQRAAGICAKLLRTPRVADSRDMQLVYPMLGLCYLKTGRWKDAETAFTHAVQDLRTQQLNVFGDDRKQIQFELSLNDDNIPSPYTGLAEALIGQGKIGAALSATEHGRARVLVGSFMSGNTPLQAILTDNEARHLQHLRSGIALLEHRSAAHALALSKARLQEQLFLADCYARHPGTHSPDTLAAVSLEDLRPVLNDGTAVLEFMAADDATYVFVVTDSTGTPAPKLTCYRIPIPYSELSGRVNALAKLYAQPNSTFQGPSTRLYDLLLRPVLKNMKGIRSLCIVPDRALWNLPFQALMTSGRRYLLEDYAISYAPSLSALNAIRLHRPVSRSPAAENMLAVGVPDPGHRGIYSGLSPLRPEAQQVDRLKSLFGRQNCTSLAASDATASRVLALLPEYRVIHFATHAVANTANPLSSYLCLYQPPTQSGNPALDVEGPLYASEILDTRLSADLVSLSACETAQGRPSSEGMVGLAWAFMHAGCRRVVASQWPVNDISAADLMTGLYRQLLRSGRAGRPYAARDALRTAALRMLNDARASRDPNRQSYRHPYYWAPFIVLGDAG